MTKYIELDAAINACYDGFADCRDDCAANIKAIPAANVVSVVRCKDCRHRDPEDKKCDSGEMERQGCPFPVADDYFCAYGKTTCGALMDKDGDGECD